jgi:hypothetical protein
MIGLSTKNSNIESMFLTPAFHKVQVLPSRRPHGERMSSSKRSSLKQGIVEHVLDVFTTRIVHVPRSLNLLQKLVGKNVPKMMYVEAQM